MIFVYFLCGCYLLKIYIDIFMYFWYTLVEVSRPVWRNGRRDGLKIRCWKQRVGSSPTTGTTTEHVYQYMQKRLKLGVF